MAGPENLRVFNEPSTGHDYYAPRTDDELASSIFHGLYHGSQAMGHPLRWSGPGTRRYLYPHLPFTPCVSITISASLRTSRVILSDIRWPALHGKQPRYSRKHGGIRPGRHVYIHSHDGSDSAPDGVDNHCAGSEGLGGSSFLQADITMEAYSIRRCLGSKPALMHCILVL